MRNPVSAKNLTVLFNHQKVTEGRVEGGEQKSALHGTAFRWTQRSAFRAGRPR